MKRLTYRVNAGGMRDILLVDKKSIKKCLKWKRVLERLAYYEDLEEEGKLQELPCKVGDRVLVKMQPGGYAEAEVRDYTYFLSCGFCAVVTSDKFNKQNIPFSEFGKTIFLAQEEGQ